MKKLKTRTLNRLSIVVVIILGILVCRHFNVYSHVAGMVFGVLEKHYQNEIEERIDYPLTQFYVGYFGFQKYTVVVTHNDLSSQNQIEIIKHLFDTLDEYKNETKSIRQLTLSCTVTLAENALVRFSTQDFVSVEALFLSEETEPKDGNYTYETMSVEDFYTWLDAHMRSLESVNEPLSS